MIFERYYILNEKASKIYRLHWNSINSDIYNDLCRVYNNFLASSNYDSALGRDAGYLDDMDYDLRVPGEILTVEVYNDYEIACLTSFGGIFVNGNEGSIRYLIESDDRASLVKEITLYKDKAKNRQVVVLNSRKSLSDKEKNSIKS